MDGLFTYVISNMVSPTSEPLTSSAPTYHPLLLKYYPLLHPRNFPHHIYAFPLLLYIPPINISQKK